MTPNWYEISRVPGFEGLETHIRSQVIPYLSGAAAEPLDTDHLKKKAGRGMTIAFIVFIALFGLFNLITPFGWVGEVVSFVVFIPLFILVMIGGLFFMRGTLARLLVAGKQNFLIRSEALKRLSEPLGLTYVPAPGGAPYGVRWLAERSWAPRELRALTEFLDAAGGLDAAVAAARETGLMQPENVTVIGSAEQKRRYHEMSAGAGGIEDGFAGERAGLRFEMFEWIERVEEAPNVYHLCILLHAPFPLHGTTHLRARRTGWPQDPDGARLETVDLGPRAFEARYRLRATDQVEARALFNPAVIERVIELAHESKFRAVAKGERLVFDFAGEDRFKIVDLMTGAWSEASVTRTAADLAEALSLIDALGHAFMLARNPS